MIALPHHVRAALALRVQYTLYQHQNIHRVVVRMASGVACRRLVGKVAMVTASTEGIGFAIAQRLGSEGAHVVISSRKQDNVDRALKELRAASVSASGIVCHVGKAEHRSKLITETVAKHGGIDILVSNAAVNPSSSIGPMLETTEEQWDKIFDVNVKATFLLIRDCVPHMRDRKGASIVIGSSVAAYTPFPFLGIGAYCVSKASLLGMTKALAGELGPDGIRVNCIAPGIIKTKFGNVILSNESLLDASLVSAAIKRPGEVEECAGTVAFLCSDDASYITGENVIISGGLQARM